jgi:microcystin-dependent protein
MSALPVITDLTDAARTEAQAKTFFTQLRAWLAEIQTGISPAQITASQNNYSPAGLADAWLVRLSASARWNITGLLAGTTGQRKTVMNVGTFPLVFTFEDAASTAANRFAFACTLGGGQSMEMVYDGTSSRWRPANLPEPIGTVKNFGTSTMPAGFLAIDQNVSRTTYAALFNEIGTTWGAGDGSTTFGLFLGAGHVLAAAGTGTQTDAGADAQVDITANTLTVPSNTDKWVTGKAVVFALTSGTVTGLTSGTTYYVVRSSATLIQLASSLANAQNGTAIDFTAKATPVWTITHTLPARTLGERYGTDTHAMSVAEMLSHTHVQPAHSHVEGGFTTQAAGGPEGLWISSYSAGGTGSTPNNNIATGSTTMTTAATNNNTGGNVAMPNTQPTAVVTRGIRYC